VAQQLGVYRARVKLESAVRWNLATRLSVTPKSSQVGSLIGCASVCRPGAIVGREPLATAHLKERVNLGDYLVGVLATKVALLHSPN